MKLPRFLESIIRSGKTGEHSQKREPRDRDEAINASSSYLAEHYPEFPPPSPELILHDGATYRSKLRMRKFGAPKGVLQDEPLYALYRIYEWIILDVTVMYRNEMESFWRKKEWRLADIPDPKDELHARYAFLACTVNWLVEAFNAKISYGASRTMNSIISPEEAEQLKAVPMADRAWESLPPWATTVPALEHTLVVPAGDDEALTGIDAPGADEFSKSKNILTRTPHIHFT